MKISGIATQGHFDPNIKEFATSFTVAHWENNKWNYGKVSYKFSIQQETFTTSYVYIERID